MKHRIMNHKIILLIILYPIILCEQAPAQSPKYFEEHCYQCHDARLKKGGLDLSTLKVDPSNPDNFARWLKIHDRIESGEMPPKKKPPAEETAAARKWLHDMLVKAEQTKLAAEVRTGLRRLTRAEYENTMRDLFDLPGIPLQGELPADGMAHGFDNNSDALDISHVNLAKYIEAADRVLDTSHCHAARPPTVAKQRISLANHNGFVAHVLLHGDAVLLKNKQPDPEFPPAGAGGCVLIEDLMSGWVRSATAAAWACFVPRMNPSIPTSSSSSRSIRGTIAFARRCGASSGTRARSWQPAASKRPGCPWSSSHVHIAVVSVRIR